MIERRSVLRGLLAAAGMTTVLGGCSGGLRPMYGTMGGNADAKLARVSIETIPGRVGQRIRNELRFQAGDQRDVPPDHKLVVNIRQSLTLTLEKRDGHSSGQVLSLDARFQLVRLQDQKVVLEGTSYARAGMERNTSIYANVRAQRDAENRAARTIAFDIRTRLSAFLATTA